MSKVLVSFGVGLHAEFLEIARPSFELFASRHGYDMHFDPPELSGRPPAWDKIPLMMGLLEEYDEVLWIGADLVIVDGRTDIKVRKSAWQAMVEHNVPEGSVPGSDFWLVRRQMLPWLQRVWDSIDFIRDGWWEQRALVTLMGYVDNPLRRGDPDNPLVKHTQFLDESWNVHIWATDRPQHPRVQHATMHNDRAAVMRDWAACAI